MAVGLLGGAFDPPHVGHLALARAAIVELGLDRLIVLVAGDPGHKHVSTAPELRLELAELAFEGMPRVSVELDRHARTVDALEERPPQDAFFVVGADELVDFWSWKDPGRVLELVRLAVATRPGVPEERIRDALARFPRPDRVVTFRMGPVSVSSSEIRARIQRGENVDGLMPSGVAAAVSRLGLYRSAE